MKIHTSPIAIIEKIRVTFSVFSETGPLLSFQNSKSLIERSGLITPIKSMIVKTIFASIMVQPSFPRFQTSVILPFK